MVRTRRELAPPAASSVAQLRAQLDAARAALGAADATLESVGQLITEATDREDREALRQHRREREEAADDQAIAARKVARLEQELADAERREDQALQRRLDDEAEVAANAAAAHAAEVLPQAYDLILSCLREIAAADQLVKQRNQVRGDDGSQILSVEARFRTRSRPEEIVSSETVRLWVYDSNGQILREDQQAEVVVRGEGVGYVQHRSPNPVSYVSLRSFRRVTFLPAVADRWHPLSETIALPGLRAGEPSVWQPAQNHARISAEDIDRRRAALAAAASGDLPDDRQPEVRLIPLVGAAAKAA